jgi:hypothetical protein
MAPTISPVASFGSQALLLLLCTVAQDVGRDDAGVQRRADLIEPREREFAIDQRLMREGAARAAVFLRNAGAKKARLAQLVPRLARHDAVFGPALDVRNEFRRQKPPRLLLEQHEVLGHP